MGYAYGPWFDNHVLKTIPNNLGYSVIPNKGADTSGRVGINVQNYPEAGHPYLTVNNSVCIGVDNGNSQNGIYADDAPNLLVIGKVGIGFTNFDPFKSKDNKIFEAGDPELNIGGRCLIRPTPDSSGTVSQDTANPILRVEQGMIFQVDAPPPAGTAEDTKYIVIGTYNNDSFSQKTVAATDHYGIGIQWDGDFARLHVAKVSTQNPNGQNDTILCWGSDYNDKFRIRFKGSKSEKKPDEVKTRDIVIINPRGTVRVKGSIVCRGWANDSDERLKKQIEPLPRTLNRLAALRAVTYEWKNSETSLDQPVGKREIGIIAQEVEQVFPEIVFTDEDGMKSVDYGRIGPILLEAVKEQQQLIKKQSEQIESLEQRIAAIENALRVQQVIS